MTDHPEIECMITDIIPSAILPVEAAKEIRQAFESLADVGMPQTPAYIREKLGYFPPSGLPPSGNKFKKLSDGDEDYDRKFRDSKHLWLQRQICLKAHGRGLSIWTPDPVRLRDMDVLASVISWVMEKYGIRQLPPPLGGGLQKPELTRSSFH